jgi:hypothetical protein
LRRKVEEREKKQIRELREGEEKILLNKRKKDKI